jgi:hypothetical protein
MGEYSHHFLLYKFETPPSADDRPYGMREGQDFADVDLVNANQFSGILDLPLGTAYGWEDGTILDLNSHYVNYSSTNTTANEVYVNVWTQPKGTAIQTMYSSLNNNLALFIPNDNTQHDFSWPEFDSGSDEVRYIWGLSCHTHKYGVDYDIYKRNSDWSQGTHVFDGSCGDTDGAPGCGSEIYDYQHPPVRYFDDYLEINMDEGLIHEASYVNDGPNTVFFGFTTDDEMMLMIYYYLEDTTGLGSVVATGIEDSPSFIEQLIAYPNPVNDKVTFQFNNYPSLGEVDLEILDGFGRVVRSEASIALFETNSNFTIPRGDLPAGLYFYRIKTENEGEFAGKLIFR